MKMTEDDRVFLRQLAKKVSKEIHQQWKAADVAGKDTSEAAGVRDRIARDAFSKVKPLIRSHLTFTHLLYYVGVVTGKIKDPD